MTIHAKNINVAEVVKADIEHHFHPFTDHKSFHAEGGPRVMTQADGIWIWDANGNKLLDGMSGLWCVNVGYGRKELAEVAYRQMQDLPYYNTFFKTTTVPATELAAKISSVMPERFKHIFFTNSGSESNDTIVRFVRHYWKLKGKPYRQHFIARTRGYHGSTMVAANLGGMQGMHEQVGTEFPGFHHVQQPYWYDFGGDKTPEEFGLEAAAAVEKKILEVGPDNVAAFIGEPIQGAGGVLIPPTTYWPEVQRICRKYGVLIISDEVICGFGRTGNWWGFQSLGFEPDIVPMAKGLSSGYLPIGAVAFADHIIKDFFELGGEFYHGRHDLCRSPGRRRRGPQEHRDPGAGKAGRPLPRAWTLFRPGPCLAARPSDRGRDPVHGPHRRHRAVQQQGQAQPLQGFRPRRHQVPGLLLQEWPDHAGMLGHDGHCAAFRDHQEGNRRTRAPCAGCP